MIVTAVDPGPQTSGFVAVRVNDCASRWPIELVRCGDLTLEQLRAEARATGITIVERAVGFGRIDNHVLATVEMVGRIKEMSHQCGHARTEALSKADCKQILCGKVATPDGEYANRAYEVAGAICRVDPSPRGLKGRKAAPGPLYGLSGGHQWDAFRLALAYLWSAEGLDVVYLSSISK